MNLFVHSQALETGGYPESCPFNTRRAGQTRETLMTMGLLSGSDRSEIKPVALTREELEWYHTPAYLDALETVAHAADLTPAHLDMGLGTPDTPVFPGLLDYVRLAGGGTLTAARSLLDGAATRAFNPSGGYHHAAEAAAAGFCYINDVVIAIMEMTRQGRRVAFVDLDVHHGEGVQAPFYDRADVLVVSMHEDGRFIFPGSGAADEIGVGAGCGYTINIPLPVGTFDAAYEEAFMQGAWPVLNAFDPDLIMVELGMDGLAGDPLAHLHLTNNVYADLLQRIVRTGKPVLAVGGGGYNIEQTVRGWALCWSVLCEDESDDWNIGMGGVMMANTDWIGGLRDRTLLSHAGRHDAIQSEIESAIKTIRKTVFPIHGL